MDGYHVDWFLRKEKQTAKDIIEENQVVNEDRFEMQLKEETDIFSSSNGSVHGNIIKSSYISNEQMFFLADTLPEKSNKQNQPHKSKKKNVVRTFIFSLVASLLVVGAVLTFLLNAAVWFVLFGLVALVLSLLYSSFSKPFPDIYDTHKFDERKNSTIDNRKTPIVCIIGFSLGLLSVASFIFFFGGITIVSSILGSAFSVDAIQKVKNHPEKYDGKGFAIAGFVLNLAVLALIIYLFVYLVYFY